MIRVLLALDESVASFRAAREGARLFRPDAEFLVINVARGPTPWLPVGGFGVVSLPPPAWDAEDPARFTEADLQQRAEEAGANPTEILTRLGDPVDCICAAAEEHDVDVVVVGGHDKGYPQAALRSFRVRRSRAEHPPAGPGGERNRTGSS